MTSARVIFEGRVQGVFFRANTKKFADKLGISGWVRNLDNGTVEAVFTGERPDIERLVEMCRNEQPHASVTRIKVEWLDETKDHKGFEIRY